MEREMLRREGIKWHVADLSGYARLKPRRAPRAVTRRGPAHLIASPSHAVKSISRTVPARRRSPPFPAARPILRARSFVHPRRALALAAGPPPRNGGSRAPAREGKYGAAPALGDRDGGEGKARSGAPMPHRRGRGRRTWPSWLITRGGPGGQRARGPGAQASTWPVRVAGHGAVATWPLHDWRVAIRRFRSGVAAAAAMLGCARHAAT